MRKKGWWKELLIALLSAAIGIIGKDTYDQAVTTPQIVATVKKQVVSDLQPVIDSTVNAKVTDELVHQYIRTGK